MAYPRRLSPPTPTPRRTSTVPVPSSEDDNIIDTDTDNPTSQSRLTPPRPFFFADDANRSSASSDNTSLDPASDSDADPPSPSPSQGVPRHAQAHRQGHRHRMHTRPNKRSSMSTWNAGYAPVDNSSQTPGVPSQAVPAPAPVQSPTPAPAPAPAPDAPPVQHQQPKPLPRPPPSSFAFSFPFQAYPGNPDPGLGIPGLSRRRSSFDSIFGVGSNAYGENDTALPRSGSLSDLRKPFAPFMVGGGGSGSDTGSISSANSLYRQSAAAAAVTGGGQGQGHGNGTTPGNIPRNSSVHSFRAPFLAPSSRPTSSLWAPPQYTTAPVLPNSTSSPSASTTALPFSGYPPPLHLHQSKHKPPLPSTRLTHPLEKSDKQWLVNPPASHRTRGTLSYLITLGLILLGAIGAGILCFTGVTSVNGPIPESNLCPILSEDFTSSTTLDQGTWNTELELSGFGNGQFEMTTSSPSNIYIQDSQLFIMPTLTSESGVEGVLDGGSFVLEGCTAGKEGVASWSGGGGGGNGANGGMGGGGGGGGGGGSSVSASASSANGGGATRSASGSAASASASAGTDAGNGNSANNFVVRQSSSNSTNNTPAAANGACSVTANAALGTVINPVQSARINTLGKKSIKYGKVEVRAKLPRGDWLWPAIFLLPTPPSHYGLWPVSGEIDLLEARGNAPSYPAQGSNFIRSSLNFSPFPSLSSSPSTSNTLLHTIFGWFSLKRDSFDRSFHTYTMEWTESFMRFSIDKRTQTILQTSTRAPSPLLSSPSSLTPSLTSSSHLSSSKHSYFNQAHFPTTARNTSSGAEGNIVAVTNPYEGVDGATPSAPFDREFFLVVDLAVGGTSGWFPDGVGGKMWFDGSSTAMRDFARAQDTWYPTWPKDASDRAFRIDYIKMWELCK